VKKPSFFFFSFFSSKDVSPFLGYLTIFYFERFILDNFVVDAYFLFDCFVSLSSYGDRLDIYRYLS